MAYVTPQIERQRVKDDVFTLISPGVSPVKVGCEIYRVCNIHIHARFCAESFGNYKFNLNPNTLRADYELWICGSRNHWYLIPIIEIHRMYEHPSAYTDYYHPNIKVVSVNAEAHRAGYASPSIFLDLRRYLKAKLDVC